MNRLLVSLLLMVLAWSSGLPATAGSRLAWSELSPPQQQALDPLRADWVRMEPESQARWLEVASRFPTLSAAERQRMHSRMAEWARLTPAQRRTARLQFQEARRVAPEDRQAAWKAYQALPEEQRQRLVQQAKAPARVATAPRSAASAPKAKVNLVQSGSPTPVRAVAAATRQARPGATTSPMTQQAPQPPSAIQHGMPKIAATPGFVDPATLLPRRGPQGAAVAQAAGSASAATTR